MQGELSAAIAAVSQRLAELGWNPSDLARHAEVDQGTVSDFLKGKRLPRIATRSKLEHALGWPAGGIEAAATGKPMRVQNVPDVNAAKIALFVSYAADTPPEKMRVLTEMMNEVLADLDGKPRS